MNIGEKIDFLNDSVKLPVMISVVKKTIDDIRPLLRIPSSEIAYMNISLGTRFEDLIEWIDSNKEKIICLDNVDTLKYCPKNDSIAQLLYTIISREEYRYKNREFDTSEFRVIIMSNDNDLVEDNYKFMDYAVGRSVIFEF